MYIYSFGELRSKVPLVEPDKTFYESVKGISLVDFPVTELPESHLPPPKSLQLSNDLIKAWHQQHAPLIEAAYYSYEREKPYRCIFPGSYIPTLNGELTCIGDLAFSIFQHTVNTVKQRIPLIHNLVKNSHFYSYQSNYKPIIRNITEPEESWLYQNIPCPMIQGVNFPLPPTYEYEDSDVVLARSAIDHITKTCHKFCRDFIGKAKKRTLHNVGSILSYITSIEYLHSRKVSSSLIRACDEVFRSFDNLTVPPKEPAQFLFEIEHAMSYLSEIRKYPLVCYGKHAMYWVDILKLPLEQLIETELCDIQRVLREIRSFFSVGWSPIVVHFEKSMGFNTDGTHRHYALLTIELLRRLKHAYTGKPIRSIDINSSTSERVIAEFKRRYKKEGLSFRETLRVVNHVINSDAIWPYLQDLEMYLQQILEVELSYIPVIYLPEWRARCVIKNLCDKGIALIGVPPENIQIVGRSRGKKGIFIRGGYHGTDRQPMVWLNYLDIQSV